VLPLFATAESSGNSHADLILNRFEAKKLYSSGAVEGMNRRTNLVTRKPYGYRSCELLKIALFQTLGRLPEPERTHRFCRRGLIGSGSSDTVSPLLGQQGEGEGIVEGEGEGDGEGEGEGEGQL